MEGKRVLSLVKVTDDAPKIFKFYPRLLYCTLTRCQGRAGSVDYLADYLGLSGEAIRRSGDALITLGLAVKAKGKFRAVKPAGEYEGSCRHDWFYWIANQTAWYGAFKYIKFWCPTKTIPPKHRLCALLGYLVERSKMNGGGKPVGYDYLAKVLGIDYRSVKEYLRILDIAKFVEHKRQHDSQRFRVRIVDPFAVPEWFRDKHDSVIESPSLPAENPRVATKVVSGIDDGLMKIHNVFGVLIGNDGQGVADDSSRSSRSSRPKCDHADHPELGGRQSLPDDLDTEREVVRRAMLSGGFSEVVSAMVASSVGSRPGFPRMGSMLRIIAFANGDRDTLIEVLRDEIAISRIQQ